MCGAAGRARKLVWGPRFTWVGHCVPHLPPTTVLIEAHQPQLRRFAVDPTSVMSFMDGNVKDIFEVDREASGAAPQLSKDIITGAAVKVIGSQVDTRGELGLTRLTIMIMLSMFLCSQEPKRQRKLEPVMKRPTGMNREVYALLYSDKNDAYVAKLHLSCHGDNGLLLPTSISSPLSPPHTHTPSLTQQFPFPHSHRHWLWLPPAQSSAGQETRPPLEMDAFH